MPWRTISPLPGPVTTIASGPVSTDNDDQFSARIGTALDGIAAGAISAVGDLVASSAAAEDPVAVRGIEAVAGQLAQEQVAVLLLASDIGREGDGAGYRIGRRHQLLAATPATPPAAPPAAPRSAGGWAALGRAASGRDRRPAPDPFRPARRPASGRAAAPRAGCGERTRTRHAVVT